ncbi:hypothetical protein J5N97_008258 [Dioscorea zingiberensis]|uniref:(S)-ureidoglycine aminohydrolase cupin domain-containing protein n=1 Tax=Dioscorea zingiberensis TaxID=325984 RepID=A0A9D5DIX0_9LILI|nr:hypothetical protein J5N97_008258 [Dioscorea zingiberensis]
MAAAALGSLSPLAALRPPSTSAPRRSRKTPAIYARFERPLEEIYNVRVERGVSQARLEELSVDRWSTWKTGKCQLPWNWHVDQQVYVVSGEVRVVPEGATSGERYMRFVAGDLVRYPKWFEADLFFNGPYEEKFVAKGADSNMQQPPMRNRSWSTNISLWWRK